MNFKNWNEEDRIKDFDGWMRGIVTQEFRDYLAAGGFFKAPSSRRLHGSFEGGNYWHSRMVMLLLIEYTYKMKIRWSRLESPRIIGMFHDICKMDEYMTVTGTDGNSHYEKNRDSSLYGHGDKSAIITLSKMHLTDEEIMCIRWHMGAFEGKETWDSYCAAVKEYPNILWVHMADMTASQVMDI